MKIYQAHFFLVTSVGQESQLDKSRSRTRVAVGQESCYRLNHRQTLNRTRLRDAPIIAKGQRWLSTLQCAIACDA